MYAIRSYYAVVEYVIGIGTAFGLAFMLTLVVGYDRKPAAKSEDGNNTPATAPAAVVS